MFWGILNRSLKPSIDSSAVLYCHFLECISVDFEQRILSSVRKTNVRVPYLYAYRSSKVKFSWHWFWQHSSWLTIVLAAAAAPIDSFCPLPSASQSKILSNLFHFSSCLQRQSWQFSFGYLWKRVELNRLKQQSRQSDGIIIIFIICVIPERMWWLRVWDRQTDIQIQLGTYI